MLFGIGCKSKFLHPIPKSIYETTFWKDAKVSFFILK